jgi:nucleoside-diphosphate-sugar epimerase
MKIAIVGASGVLGQQLVPRLLGSGHSVVALARNPEKLSIRSSKLNKVPIDLLSTHAESELDGALHGCDAAIHIATAIPQNPMLKGAWDDNTRIRTEGTRMLLAACRRHEVRRYLQQSIVLAYPDCGEREIVEAEPLDRGETRKMIAGPVIEMEQQITELPNTELEWCILRCGSFLGEGTFEQAAIARLLSQQSPTVRGGQHFLSLVHVVDVAEAFLVALERARPESVYNVCAPALRQRDYLAELARRVGAAPPGDVDSGMAISHRCSAAAIKRDLGWQAVRGVYPPPKVIRTQSNHSFSN